MSYHSLEQEPSLKKLLREREGGTHNDIVSHFTYTIYNCCFLMWHNSSCCVLYFYLWQKNVTKQSNSNIVYCLRLKKIISMFFPCFVCHFCLGKNKPHIRRAYKCVFQVSNKTIGWLTHRIYLRPQLEIRFISCFTSRSTARVILRRVVYGWRNQCILVGQDSAR